MPIFIKENQELNKNSYKIPKNLQQHLQKTLAKYSQYKQENGFKRLNSLINPNYNNRSENKNQKEKEISYSDLKRIDYDFRHMSKNPNDLQRTLNGGEKFANFVRDTLNKERNRVEPRLKEKKVQTRQKNSVKPIVKPTKPTSVKENKQLLENYNGEHKYYDYLDEYSVYEIFEMFTERKNPWLPLINPSMYAKALQEFTKYGKLIHFPTDKIYQWFGIVMKNTAILRHTTEICGHSAWFPTDDFVDYFFEGDYDKWDEYKESVGEENDYYAAWGFLDEKGFDDWNKLPDGSDALSDFGIEPLERLISQYNDNMTPEQVLVLLNKCIDVVHCRGDLSSMFVQGGAKVLNQISEEIKRKNIYLTEKQLNILKKYL